METLDAWSIICMEIWPNKHKSEKIQAFLKISSYLGEKIIICAP